jgi:hypothetical protein
MARLWVLAAATETAVHEMPTTSLSHLVAAIANAIIAIVAATEVEGEAEEEGTRTEDASDHTTEVGMVVGMTSQGAVRGTDATVPSQAYW